MEPRELAVLCAQALSNKMARNTVILDVRQLVDIADFFVISTGMNERQIRSMAEELGHLVTQHGLSKLGVEGATEAKWVLFDLGDVIVHVLTEEGRSFYALEMLWGEAPEVDWEDVTQSTTNRAHQGEN